MYNKERIQMRRSLRRGLDGVHGSKNLSGSRTGDDVTDVNQVKRVRFASPGTVFPLRDKHDVLHAEGAYTPRSNGPKTSEYAFYKKIREAAGKNLCCHKQEYHLKKFESSNCTEDLANVVKHNCEEIRPLLSIEKSTSIDLRKSFSLIGVSKDSGPQYRYKEVFMRKRQKLCQLAAEALALEADECCSKGYDLVSVLLQRLVPSSKPSQSCKVQSLNHVELDNRHQLLDSHDLDIHFKEQSKDPTINQMEPIAQQYLDEGLLDCWSKQSREVIPSPYDKVDCDSLSNVSANEILLQCKHGQPSFILDVGKNTVLHTKKEPDFGIDPGNTLDRLLEPSKFEHSACENFSSNWHFWKQSPGPIQKFSSQELDELYALNEPTVGTKQSTKFLGKELSVTNYGCVTLDQLLEPSKFEHSACESFSSHWHLWKQSPGPVHKLSSKVLDELYALNEPTVGIQQNTKFLGWDDKDMKNKAVLSSISHDMMEDLSPTRTTSFGDDQQCTLNSNFDTNSLQIKQKSFSTMQLEWYNDSSSILAIDCSPKISLWPYFLSESHPKERQFPDEKDYSVAMPNHFLMSLCSENYLAQDCKGSILLNPMMSEVFKEKLYPNADTLLHSGLNLDVKWKNLSITDFFRKNQLSNNPDVQFVGKETEGLSSFMLTGDKTKSCLDRSSYAKNQIHFAELMSKFQDLSSFSFRISLNKEEACPFLSDRSSLDESEREMSSDYSEDIHLMLPSFDP
ncbi:PREDICTED: uncharacterized protein LOC104602117 isoform X2 [Nelumbo nucifera]|uniref:Uncharacterized protein n=2 Tax=Nelumbo nucifera TaxID=4432 RepID=A0A822YW65_NELNU|nr:PREDICTED: uncharacterized protein LOC104602117 isoform X2 [Nelumbo nucifera]DAD36932.1 TPA_asm: hypothetical protein HUJ06_007573 [Nelumbo nucifera]